MHFKICQHNTKTSQEMQLIFSEAINKRMLSYHIGGLVGDPDIKRGKVETKETIIDHSEETQEFFTSIRTAKSMKYILNNR